MTLLVVMMSMVNALTVGAYTVTLTAGEGTGADIIIDSADPANMAESMNTARDGQFWMEGEQLWFKTPGCPDSFTAPGGYWFDGWDPDGLIPVTENTVLTAQWSHNASFTLKPTAYNLAGSGFTEIPFTSSFISGPDDNYEHGEIKEISCWINGGTLTNGNGRSIPFLVAELDDDFSIVGYIDIPESGSFVRFVWINPDDYDNAVPGVYKGSLSWGSLWGDGILVGGPSGSVALTLVVTRPEHTVTFDPQGGTVSPASMTTNYWLLSSLPEPTRDGWLFDGWWSEVTGGSRVGTNTEFDSDATIYAHWYQEVTVTFDPQGGTVTPAGMTTDHKKLSSLPTPTRNGWWFKGWYTAAEGGSEVDTSTEFTSNTTIYAQWYQEATVTFDPNGGMVTPAGMNTDHWKLSSLPEPTRDGWTFDGWWTEATGGSRVTTNTEFDSDVTIYAHWYQEVTVTFDPQGGTVTPASMKTDHWKLTSLPTPTRYGFRFMGWYTALEGGSKVDTSTEFTSNTTVYAQWIVCSSYTLDVPKQVTITPNTVWTAVTMGVSELTFVEEANGKTPNILRVVFEGGTLTNQNDKTKTIPFKLNTVVYAPQASNQKLLNYSAVGNKSLYIYIPGDSWNSAENGVYSGTISYYVLWRYPDNTGSGKFGSGSISVEIGRNITVAADPAEGGTVTGGSSGTYADGTRLELKATANEGYRFVNWTIDGINGGSEPIYPFTVGSDFSEVAAHFERVYPLSGTNVEFYVDGGNITEAAEGEQVTLSPNPVNLQDGYYLTGEYQSDDVEITKEEDSEESWFMMPAKAVTVNAVAAQRTEYEIDLTTATEQEIDEEARMALMMMDGYFGSECDETGCVQYLDLNLDGMPDLQLTENADEATWVYGVTKLAGANQLTENYRLSVQTYQGSNPLPYSSVLVKLVSGSGTHNLPQIVFGDVNGDGLVTVTDAALLMDYLAHPNNAPAGFILQAADVDGIGGITPADAVEILKMILE